MKLKSILLANHIGKLVREGLPNRSLTGCSHKMYCFLLLGGLN